MDAIMPVQACDRPGTPAEDLVYLEGSLSPTPSGPQLLSPPMDPNHKRPDEEPVFKVLKTWQKRGRKFGGLYQQSSTMRTAESFQGNPRDGQSGQQVRWDSTSTNRKSRSSRFVLHPYDWRRGLWDLVSLALVMHDMAFVPLQFFEPPETAFVYWMAWFTRVFWTVDVPASLITGFVSDDGFIELRLENIIPRYLRSWMLLDFVIVSLDWLELVVINEGGVGLARMGKATRTFRIIRMLRLLRLARMRQVLAILTERLRSEKVVVIFDICRLMIGMIAFSHFIACFWYGVGAEGLDSGKSWINIKDLADASLGVQYSIALHWSMSQLAGGMDEVTPETHLERVYAIISFLLGFVVAAWFVSSLTSSMTQLNIIGSDKTQQMSALRVYLNQNGITHKLSLRVQRNAQFALAEQQRALPESNVELLRLVSVPLRVEIHMEMYAPLLSAHPFFHAYINSVPQVMRKVCHLGTQMLSISAGDVVFSAGEIPSDPKMYIVCNGVLAYDRGFRNRISERQWIAEPVLWTEWVHMGDCVSTGESRLCLLDANAFQKIAMHFEHDGVVDPGTYAEEFVAKLNALPEDELSDLTPVDMRPSSRHALVVPDLTTREHALVDEEVGTNRRRDALVMRPLQRLLDLGRGLPWPLRAAQRRTAW